MIETVTLDNGLKIVFEKIPYVRSAAFGIWIKTGTRYEKPEENGVSHFIEHMMFKGTKKRSARQIAEEMDAMGGQINAYTTKEYTCYYTRVLDRNFDAVLDVLSDMILNSKFDAGDIEREKDVIDEEIDMYLDAPEELVHDALEEAVWRETSMGMPICGTKDSLAGLNRDVIKSYYEKNYRPQNAVAAFVGNFDRDAAVEKIKKAFGGWSGDKYEKTEYGKATYVPSKVMIEKNVEQIHLCFTFKAPERDSRHKYALAVLNTLFGGGMSSKLFQKIREDEGLVYTIYSYTSAYSDTGVMTVYACTSPQKAEAVIKSVFREISAIKNEKIEDRIIDVTREQIISNYIIGGESTAGRLTTNGGSMALTGKVPEVEEVLEQMDRVDYASVKAAVDEVLDPDNFSFSAVGNIEGIDIEGMMNDGKQILYSKN